MVGSAVLPGGNDKACDDLVCSFLKQWQVSTLAFFRCASLFKYGADDFCCEFIRQFFHMQWIVDICLFIFALLAGYGKSTFLFPSVLFQRESSFRPSPE